MEDAAPAPAEEQLAAVEAFCRRRATVEAADILAEFLQLPQALLDSHVLPTLLERAVLQPTDQPDRCCRIPPRCRVLEKPRALTPQSFSRLLKSLM